MQGILYAKKGTEYAKYLAMQSYFICHKVSSHGPRAGVLQQKPEGNAGGR